MRLKELICGAMLGIAVLCTPACQTNELLTDLPGEAYTLEEQVTQTLIESARQGETEAYRALALRYRDGIGCEENVLTAFLYHGIHCVKTGVPDKQILNLYEEGHPYHLLFELLDGPLHNTTYVSKKIAELEKVLPLEAEVLRIVVLADMKGMKPDELAHMKELRSKGSILSPLMLTLYYEDLGLWDEYVELMESLTQQHPFFNSLLANYYEDQYWKTQDTEWVYKAIDHYELADAHGLLTPRFAKQYMNLCLNMKFDGVMNISDKEVARLEKIATVKKPE